MKAQSYVTSVEKRYASPIVLYKALPSAFGLELHLAMCKAITMRALSQRNSLGQSEPQWCACVQLAVNRLRSPQDSNVRIAQCAPCACACVAKEMSVWFVGN